MSPLVIVVIPPSKKLNGILGGCQNIAPSDEEKRSMGDVSVELFHVYNLCFRNHCETKKKMKVELQISMGWCVGLRTRI